MRYSMEVEGVKEGEGEGAVVTLTGGKTIKAQVGHCCLSHMHIPGGSQWDP